MIVTRVRRCILLGALLSLICGCGSEPLPGEAEGAYLLFRQAMFDKDVEKVYGFLSKDTKKLFDDRVLMMGDMSSQISQFLPQVDQKLARRQTGVTLLSKHKLETGQDLFKLLFNTDVIKKSDEVVVGSEVADLAYLNEEKTAAALVTYGEDKYRLVLEEDNVWRVASWQDFATVRTSWIDDNNEALERTIQDLQEEKKEEIDKVLKFLLKRG